MTVSSTYQIGLAQPASQDARVQPWTETWLQQMVARLLRRVVGSSPSGEGQHVVDEIVHLGMQPDVLIALRGRRDRQEAVRDIATRYAFQALMEQGRAIEELDPLSQALIRRTLDVIYKRARQVEWRVGEDPLSEDPNLLLSICKSLGRYVPRKPMGAHITWKLRHYESAVSRAMRQIENLVRLPQVTGPFVTYVLDAGVPDVLKAHLLQLARGGGRSGMDYEAMVRFFALPATVAFVKRFAGDVQTARTLYAEEEYESIPWCGQRRLPAKRRQGYLEAALARFERVEEVSLDAEDLDMHDLLPADRAWPGASALHNESFAAWVTRRALEARPDDPLWQAGDLLFVRGLSPGEIVKRGLAEPEMVAAAQERVEALQADPDVWQAWMAATLD
jgi:hypothetical protein